MIEGGSKAGDQALKERRKMKKKASESLSKALVTALGHVDDEDGVLVKVYDDIQVCIDKQSLKISFINIT